MRCNICDRKSTVIMQGTVLNKYRINYYQCGECQFIQTESPYWLEESYAKAISALDVGLVSRNMMLIELISPILKKYFPDGKYIDFGGGYGLFVRMMRDRGFDFYRYDIHCDNIFAEYFDIVKYPENNISEFTVLTSFEVFEHLVYPHIEIETMFDYSKNVLFSTELLPDKKIKSTDDWWYFVTESGQHISFYSLKSLHVLAEKYNKKLYTNGKTLHLLTDVISRKNIIKKSLTNRLISTYKARRYKSLLDSDLYFIKRKINL